MEKLTKARVAPEAFNMLILMGMWRPDFCSNFGKRLLYDGYAFLTIALTELLGLSMILGVFWKSKSIDEVIEGSYLLLPFFNGNVKCFNVLLQRRQFQKLIDLFLQAKYLPNNEYEFKMYRFFAKMSRFISLYGVTVAEGAAACIMIVPVVYSNETHVFPLASWRPYDSHDDELAYWCFYLHQVLGLFTIAMWNTAADVLISGLMLHTCFQLDLMAHRLQALPRLVSEALERNSPTRELRDLERRIIRRSVHHHLHILEIAESLKRSFGPCILSQYCLSGVLLCVAIYKMANVKADASQLVVMLLYVSAMVYELFIYCFFGNEVTHKSLQFADTICDADWTVVHVSSMKSLLFMMLRTSRPIKISCGPLVTLSNDTFVGILKLSYSVFNVLKRSQ